MDAAVAAGPLIFEEGEGAVVGAGLPDCPLGTLVVAVLLLVVLLFRLPLAVLLLVVLLFRLLLAVLLLVVLLFRLPLVVLLGLALA
jgi:hypothetical protein